MSDPIALEYLASRAASLNKELLALRALSSGIPLSSAVRGQTGIRVYLDGEKSARTIDLTSGMKLSRGMEMIALGIRKSLNERIDEIEKEKVEIAKSLAEKL